MVNVSLFVRVLDMNKRKGFTLIELLVVISIIALLMSMLMPALARVRKQAKAVACQMELKQWGIVWNVYFNENNNKLPDSIMYANHMEPYYVDRNLLKCPSAMKTLREGAREPYVCWEEAEQVGSYSFNGWCMSIETGNRAYEYLWLTPDVKMGDKVPILMDGGRNYMNVVPLPEEEPPEYEGQPQSGNESEINRVCINRHEGGINLLFLDMTVCKTTLKGLWDLDWSKYWRDNDMDKPDWPEWIEAIN